MFSKKLNPGHCLKLTPFYTKCDAARGSDSQAPSKIQTIALPAPTLPNHKYSEFQPLAVVAFLYL